MFTVIGTTTLDSVVPAPDRPPRQDGDEFTTNSLVFCDEPPKMLMGGNGGNTAYVLGMLGASTALCSGIGQDYPGDILLDWLRRAAVDVGNVVRDSEKGTSSTTVILDQKLNRRAFHYHGASGSFGPSDFPAGTLGENDVLLVTGYPLLTGWRSPKMASVLRRARRNGATTAFDIGPAIGEPVTLEEMRPLLPHLDYLLCNAHEGATAVNTSDDDPGTVASRLHEAGAAAVILKQGPRGASFLESETSSLRSVNGFSVSTGQTIGAGDSFNAGFLFARHHGYSLGEAVRFANAVAALVIASGRGVLGCPTRTEVMEFIAGRIARE